MSIHRISKFIFPIAILLPFCLISIVSKAQSLTCDQLLDTRLHCLKGETTDADSVNTDLKLISMCGYLDEIDTEILNAQVLGTLIIDLANDKQPVTYRRVIERYKEKKNNSDFVKLREAVIISKKLENEMPTPQSFVTDSVLLSRVGMPAKDISRFKAFLESNGWEETTYKEAFAAFQAKQPIQPEVKSSLRFDEFTSLENAKNAGATNKKNILIYFSGYACVSARKMEDRILVDQDVKDIITNNFVYQVAYADDNRQIGNTTAGKQIQQLQTDYFKSNSQPVFYIIDDKGNILAESNYTSSKDDFIIFLKKGLKK